MNSFGDGDDLFDKIVVIINNNTKVANMGRLLNGLFIYDDRVVSLEHV